MRIVSLIASATEIVDALGCLDQLVGRSHECDYPERVLSLPVCTRPRIDVGADSRQIDEQVKQQLRDAVSVYDVFADVIRRLEPTHIITQTQCEVCAVSLSDVRRALGTPPDVTVVPLHPNCLEDVWTDIRRVAESLGVPSDEPVQRLKSRMDALRRAATTSKPRVACIEWLEPLMAAGNWVPELVEMAGGVNLFGEAGRHSPWMTWEELVESDPDVLVLMPCGWSVERTLSEIYWLENRPGWSGLRAVRTGRVHVVDGNQYFNRPGPRLVESLQILVELFQRPVGAQPAPTPRSS